MGIIIRQSIINTIYSYVGVALGFVSTILLFPNILTPDQYGLTRVLISIALVSAQFSHLGMKNTIIRYFPYFKVSRETRSKLLTLSVGITLFGFLLFTALFFLFRDLLVRFYTDQSELFQNFYFYLLPLVFAILFFDVLNTYIRALKDSVTGSFVSEVLVRSLIVLILILYYFGVFDFAAFMLLFILVYGLQPVYLLVYLFVKGELSLSGPFGRKVGRLGKGMGVYSFYALLGGVTTLLVGNIDILMLGSMTDLASTAVYSIAFYVGTVITVPKRSIDKIALPVLSDFIKEKRYHELESLYKRTSLNQTIAGGLLLIGIWANMDNLMHFLPQEYHGGRWVILVIGLAKLFDMATGINGSIILHFKFYRFDLYFGLFLVLLTIATNYLLIPVYGILGAAIATAISIFISHSIKYLFVWAKFSMQPFRWNTLGIVAIGLISLGASSLLAPLGSVYLDLPVRSALIAGIYLGSIYLLNLSTDFRNLADATWERIRNFTAQSH